MDSTGTKLRLVSKVTLLVSALVALALGLGVASFVKSGSSEQGQLKSFYRKADNLLWSNHFPEAEEFLKAGMAKHGETVDGLLRLGIAQSLQEKYDESESTFFSALKIQPDEPRVLHNLGLLYLRQERYDDAVAYFRKTLEVDPSHPQSNFYIGVIQRRQGQPEEALESVVKELNVNAPNASAWKAFLEMRETSGPPPKKGFPWNMAAIWLVVVGASGSLYLLKRSFLEPGESPGFSDEAESR